MSTVTQNSVSVTNKLKTIYKIVFLIIIVIAFPIFDSNIYHISLGIMVGIYLIVNLGLNMLLGNTGQISLGQAAFFGIGHILQQILQLG